MYESEYRFALKNAGFDGFRVLLFHDSDGLKAASGEPGLKFTVDFGLGMLNALHVGDVMNDLIYQVRPFEVNKGETEKVFQGAMDKLSTTLRDRPPFEIMQRAPKLVAGLSFAKKKAVRNTFNTLGKIREHLYGDIYLDALERMPREAEHGGSRPHPGKAGRESHRRILGPDHRRRRQLPHVRVSRARRARKCWSSRSPPGWPT